MSCFSFQFHLSTKGSNFALFYALKMATTAATSTALSCFYSPNPIETHKHPSVLVNLSAAISKPSFTSFRITYFSLLFPARFPTHHAMSVNKSFSRFSCRSLSTDVPVSTKDYEVLSTFFLLIGFLESLSTRKQLGKKKRKKRNKYIVLRKCCFDCCLGFLKEFTLLEV